MFNNFAFLDLGTPELIIIAAIILLLFGSKKLPALARSMGSSMRELRKGMSEGDDEKNRKQTTEEKHPEQV